eukprot:TRINITY_DN78033_c0_g1_i1.p1 TRINITY_DN78033_c0_g1~~TRINITY_DN78033_c0_g1_i1.p1  ORF type:complete len:472 (-),score=81.13 TRINITY_DN78033_c0_g1_i1:487-1809(-)
MSSSVPPHHLRFDSAFSGDDDFSQLTIVQVSPRHSPAPRVSPDHSHSSSLSVSTSSRYTSHPSVASDTLATPELPAVENRPPNAPPNCAGKQHARAGDEPFSFASLFASFKHALNHSSPSSANSKGASAATCSASPSSVTLAPQKAQAKLSTPIFRAIDGADAREFRLFLDDHSESKHNVVINLAPYGRSGTYAADIFVIVHNTIRLELVDTFHIVAVIRTHFLSLSVRDVHNFRQWWRFFFLLWSEYITYHNNLLEPIIHNICQVDGRSDVLRRRLRPLRSSKEWLCLKMEEITSYVEEFESLPPARALCLICNNIHSFAESVNAYFRACEKLLPPFIESYHGEQLKLSIECQLIEQLRKSEHFPELMASIIRWIGSTHANADVTLNAKQQAKERDRWLASHMVWLERPKVWYFFQRYEATHRSIFTRFVTRVRTLDSM